MAFDIRNLENHSSSGGGVRLMTYRTTVDNKAAVKGAGYFNDGSGVIGSSATLVIEATDATFMAEATTSAGVVTLAALDTFA